MAATPPDPDPDLDKMASLAQELKPFRTEDRVSVTFSYQLIK